VSIVLIHSWLERVLCQLTLYVLDLSLFELFGSLLSQLNLTVTVLGDQT